MPEQHKEKITQDFQDISLNNQLDHENNVGQ